MRKGELSEVGSRNAEVGKSVFGMGNAERGKSELEHWGLEE